MSISSSSAFECVDKNEIRAPSAVKTEAQNQFQRESQCIRKISESILHRFIVAALFYSTYFIVPKKGGGLRPILDLRVLNQALNKLPFNTETLHQMHPAPGVVCSGRPEGHVLQCLDPSSTQAVPTVCVRGSDMAVRVLPFRAVSVPPCLYEGRGGHPCPVMGSGHQDPPSRWLAHHGPVSGTVVWSQGPGAPGPQPVGALGQLGKAQALPCAENLFSQYGVRLGEYDGASHHRACPVRAELAEFIQRHDGGTTETFSEAPGAYGIRSHSRAARVASYETTSALVTLPSPEMGMSPLVEPLVRPCLSMGRGALRTSV